MVDGKLKELRYDNNGAAIMEFTIVSSVLLTLLFGILEFTNLFYQWNAATKAVQVGTRLAAVSAPVWQDAASLNGLENPNLDAGEALDTTNYDYRTVCIGTSNGSGICNLSGNLQSVGSAFDPTAMDTIVFGRGSTSCDDPPGTYFGMCDIYDRITSENVQVTYEQTNAGYAARPGGIVPTITIQLVGLNFEFIFLDHVMRFWPGSGGVSRVIPIPGLRTTMIAEDMRTAFNGLGNGGGGGTTTNGNGNGNN